MTKHILVTGASGYIASRLIPQLLERGHRVRALARRPHVLRARRWFNQVEVVQGDVLDPASLGPALKDTHTAYYLIHNMSLGRGYTEREREGARNFAAAAEQADLQHIIYLGGLADHRHGVSNHLSSRIETGAGLRQGRVPVTEFRSGIIAGSGSISFEMIRFMTEFFPIIPAPIWLKNKSQPIAVQNVLDYLLAALENWNGHGHVYEIGGPDRTHYLDLMLKYARIRGHRRGFILFPYVPVWFMASGIHLMSPVPYRIASALMGGLSDDSVVQNDEVRRVFQEVRLIDFESAAREALTHLHPLKIEHVWDDGGSGVRVLKHEGFFIDHRALQLNAAPGGIFKVITEMGGRNGWPFANWLWKLRGWVDRLLQPAPGAKNPGGMAGQNTGDYEYYQVDSLEADHLLLLHSRLQAPGEGWMEWRVTAREGGARLSQTAYFAPRGLGGFIYWYLLYPFHAFVFHGTIHAIEKLVQKSLHVKHNP